MLGSGDYTDCSAEECFRLGLCDPVRLFIKNEPHKVDKISADMLRIISGVAIPDQLVDRCLYGAQNENEIFNYREIPTKIGMGLHDEGITEILGFVADAAAKGIELAEGDVSGWDFSVQAHELKFDAELRIKLYGSTCGDWLRRAIRNRHHLAANKVFVTSSGHLFAQKIPGIMMSGWYCTGSTNSHVNYSVIRYGGSRWGMVAGDDMVAEHTDKLKATYERFGKRVKVYKRTKPDDFEFCSTRFIGGTGIPLSVPKMCYNALAKKVTNSAEADEVRLSLTHCFRNLPGGGKDIISHICDIVVPSHF